MCEQKEHLYHRCEPAASHEVEATKEELLGFYDTMFTMRRMELAADAMYKQRLIRGFLHLYNGQEAVATGLNAALHPEDGIVTAYRDHGFSLLRGGTVETILAELIGRATGVSKGKGGSMHLYDPKHHFYGGNAIVGAQVPMGAGIAFANKYLNNGKVCVAAYGDGAANQGQVRPRHHRPMRETGEAANRQSLVAPRSLRPSTWRRSGSCRASSWSRTTTTPWARRLLAVLRRASSTSVVTLFLAFACVSSSLRTLHFSMLCSAVFC